MPKETNAGILDEQWDLFSVIFTLKWKRFFRHDEDELGFGDFPDDVPEVHKYWIKVLRDAASDVLAFEHKSDHLIHERSTAQETIDFLEDKVDDIIGEEKKVELIL